jgi:uncharacterized protein DUF4855
VTRWSSGLAALGVIVLASRPMSSDPVPSTRWILAYPGTPKGGIGITYTVADFVRLLAATDTSGQPRTWLCTGVIFLQLYAPSGRIFTTWGHGIPATGADWEEYLDSLTHASGALARLDTAVAVVQARIGSLPAALPVALMIPYPEPKEDTLRFAREWYSLRTNAGRVAAASAYVREATSRVRAARFRHLRLDGFYWLSENVAAADTATVKGVAAAVHGEHLRFLWVPYYFALGQGRWRALGFDEAWLQPNYFFDTTVAASRLDSAAAHAQAEGLGIEVEFNAKLMANARYAGRLDPYLNMLTTSAALRNRPVVIYDGQGELIYLSRSNDAPARALYERLVKALTARDTN